jgi:hypothetical protein
MKKPSSDLFELVQTLTPSERRHFTLRMGSRDLQYARLLEALLDLPAYDEAELIRRLREKGSVKHLSVAKRHLYFLLLDDLLASRPERIEDSVRKGSEYIRMLWEKGLNDQARKLIGRYKQKAHEYELYRPLLDLLDLEKKLSGARTGEEQIEALYQEEAGALERLANVNAYWRIASQISRLQRQYQKMQGEEQQQALTRFFHDPLLKDIDQATTLQSKIYFLRARATYYFTAGQPKDAYRLNRQLLELLGNSPAFLKQFPEIYLQTFNNFLIDSLELGYYEAFSQGLDELSALSNNPHFRPVKDLEARLFRQRYLLEINSYLSRGAIDQAAALMPEIERGLAKHGAKLQKTHRITFQYLLAYVLWLNGQHERSLDWIHQLLQEKEDVMQEIFQFTRVLNLLVHYGLGNWEHLSYLLPSTRRYLRQRRDLYRTETALFQFLQKAINTPREQATDHYRSFSEEVKSLSQERSEQRFFNYIDMKAWFDRFDSGER